MLLDCFPEKGKGRLVCINGKMNGAIYCGQRIEDKMWLALPVSTKANSQKNQEVAPYEADQGHGVSLQILAQTKICF